MYDNINPYANEFTEQATLTHLKNTYHGLLIVDGIMYLQLFFILLYFFIVLFLFYFMLFLFNYLFLLLRRYGILTTLLIYILIMEVITYIHTKRYKTTRTLICVASVINALCMLAFSHSRILAFSLSRFLAFSLSRFLAFSLSHFLTFSHSRFLSFLLSCFLAFSLSCFLAFSLSCFLSRFLFSNHFSVLFTWLLVDPNSFKLHKSFPALSYFYVNIGCSFIILLMVLKIWYVLFFYLDIYLFIFYLFHLFYS
jgi:hypothetical protein